MQTRLKIYAVGCHIYKCVYTRKGCETALQWSYISQVNPSHKHPAAAAVPELILILHIPDTPKAKICI